MLMKTKTVKKNTTPCVCAIVLHYGALETTMNCLASILKGNFLPDIILIDNDPSNRFSVKSFGKLTKTISHQIPVKPLFTKMHIIPGTSGSGQNLYFNVQFKQGSEEEKVFCTIHYIQSAKNIGFSAGVNLGMRFALELGKDFVTLLNNDIKLSPNTFEILIKYSQTICGITGALEKELSVNGEKKDNILFAGGTLVWREVPVFIKTSPDFPDIPYDVDFIRGSCMVIPSNVIKTIGIFDEQFFAYQEDVDYVIRATERGFSLTLIPEAVIWHKVAASSQVHKRNFLMTYGYVKLLRKHAKGRFFLKGMLWNAAAALLSLFNHKRRGKLLGFIKSY